MDDDPLTTATALLEQWAKGEWTSPAPISAGAQRLIAAAKAAVRRARDEENFKALELEKAIDVAADSLARLVIEGDLTRAALPPTTASLGLSALYESVNQSAHLLREFVTGMKKAAHELSTGTHATYSMLQKNAEVLRAQAGVSQELAATLTELTSSSIEIARNAASVAELSRQSQLASAAGSAAVQDFSVLMSEVEENAALVASAVSSLTTSVQQIGDVIRLITEVADRSDMLALNAGLEAARAGYAGRGFAIVAAEMRRLSARVMNSATEISTLITGVRQATDRVRERAEANIQAASSGHDQALKALEHLGGITAAVHETSAAADLISHATGQQRSATAKAKIAISELSAEVKLVAGGAEKTRESAEKVRSVSTWMDQLVDRFYTGD